MLIRRCKILVGKGADEASKQNHEQRRPDTVITNIRDTKSDLSPLVERKEIIKISAHLAGGLEVCDKLPSADFRQPFRKKNGRCCPRYQTGHGPPVVPNRDLTG